MLYDSIISEAGHGVNRDAAPLMERVDGALRKRFLGLTGPMGPRVVVAADALGHSFGVRVQRGRLTGLRPEGCGRLMAAGCVEGLRKKVLRIDGPFRAQGFLSLTALRAEGCGIALSGDEYYNAAFRRSRPHRVS